MSKKDHNSPDENLEHSSEPSTPHLSPQEAWEEVQDEAFQKVIQKAIDTTVTRARGKRPRKPEIERVAKNSILEIKSLALQYSSPIPPGIILREYEDIVPGSADRILSMAERSQEQSVKMDNDFVGFQNKNLVFAAQAQSRGSWFAFIICLVGFGVGLIATLNGQPTFGIQCVGGTLATVAGIFLFDRLKKEKK